MKIFGLAGDVLGTVLGFILWFFFDLFDRFIPAVFVFVVIMKVLSLPFELKSRKAMAKNSKITAKTQELQKKYANNRQKMNEEMAKLYEKEGMNPFGGCLPQLFPMFVFMGIYGAIFRPLTNLFHVSPKIVDDATRVLKSLPDFRSSVSPGYMQLEIVKVFPQFKDKLTMFTIEQVNDILDFNRGFNFLGLDLFAVPISNSFMSFAWIWPALSAVTMILSVFVSQKLMGSDSLNSAPGCAKFLPFAIPLIFVWWTLNAPAALGAYYTIFNLVTIAQSFFIAKFYSMESIFAREEAARIARLEIIEAGEREVK